jgi:hypothetical protein
VRAAKRRSLQGDARSLALIVCWNAFSSLGPRPNGGNGIRRITIKKPQMTAANDKRGVFDMFRGILKLTLCLSLGAVATPAALAQTAAPITEQEAHAIAVDAYVYFYPIMSMNVSRKQFTNGTT